MSRRNKPGQRFAQDIGIQVRTYHGRHSSPEFGKPTPIGFFSLTSERIYDPSSIRLQYYKPPAPNEFPLNLQSGMEQVKRKPESAYHERLDHLLRFIYDNFQNLQVEEMPRNYLKAQFVCYRGTLKSIMTTPYDKQNDWCIVVTRFRRTIYMWKKQTEKSTFERLNETKRSREMSSWGFKMEQYLLVDSPDGIHKTEEPVDESPEFSCVFNTKMNDFNVLYGAEMDGIDSEVPIDDLSAKLQDVKFIEIKTMNEKMNEYQIKTYQKNKTCNWWCQSYLVGIDDIYVGMRNDKGMVNRIRHMPRDSLSTEAQGQWKPAACKTFLVDFLKRVKDQTFNMNCPYTTIIYNFDPVTSRITYERVNGRSEYSFLPDWYLELFKRNESKMNKNV